MNDCVKVSITKESVIVTCLLIFSFYLIFELREVLLVLLASIIFSFALTPAKNFLVKYKIPQTFAVFFLYIVFFFTISIVIYLIIPILSQQYVIFIENLPGIFGHLSTYLEGTFLEEIVEKQKQAVEQITISGFVKDILGFSVATISTTFSKILNVILFLVFTFILTVSPGGLIGLLNVSTPIRYRPYMINLLTRVQVKIANWFQGQLILIVVIGALTFVLLSIINIPNAFLLGVFAGLMEFVPLFGPIIASVPAILSALSTGDPTLIIYVVLIFIIVQQLESIWIYPLVVSKMVGIDTILVIIAVVSGAKLAGFLGVLIAVPVVACIQEIYRDIKDGVPAKFINEGQKN